MKASSLAALVILAAGCSPPPPTAAPAAPPPAPKKDRLPAAMNQLSYKTPPEWISEEVADSMRKAQYRIPDKGGKGAAASLTFFSMAPQNLETIVDYWKNKMGGADASVSKIEGAAAPTTLVDIAGEYSDGQASLADARFLGAIIEVGDRTWYLKMVGPAATVSGWKDAFVEMLKGLRPIE